MKRNLGLAIAGWLLLVASTFTAAQDAYTEGDDLQARLQALEQQNMELRRRIEEGPAFHPASHELDSSYIESVVDQRLAEIEAYRTTAEGEERVLSAADGHEIGSDLGMTASWNHGVELTSKNKDFRLHIGGRTQFDTAWYSVEEDVQADPKLINPYEDGVNFRRARIRLDGTMHEFIDFAVEYDFMQAFRLTGVDRPLTAPTDLWWTFKEIPYLGNIRVGNHKQAIGFEHLVSSRFLPFMERSFNQDAFYGGQFNGFQPGISAFDTYDNEYGTWNMGLYKPTDNMFAFSANTGDYMAVARITRLLWYVQEGRGLLHVGMSGLQQTTVGDRYVFRARDALRTGIFTAWPVPANTGPIAGDDMQWANFELVSVYGPWTFQSEYLISNFQDAAPVIGNVVQPTIGDVVYHGGYAQLLYFLTGENDRYNRKTGVFDRVIPNENFFLVRDPDGNHLCGLGAWQVGLRYSYLDLNDEGLNGGVLHNVTSGVNWFLNPNMKIQSNYIATHRNVNDPGDGWIHGWGMRVAHDF